MIIFNHFNVQLLSASFLLSLLLCSMLMNPIVQSQLNVNHETNETLNNTSMKHSNSNFTSQTNSNKTTSTITKTNITSTKYSMIKPASFTMTDSSYYHDHSESEHYDKNKVNYEKYFKNSNLFEHQYHHHHHHHHHHDHHHHHNDNDAGGKHRSKHDDHHHRDHHQPDDRHDDHDDHHVHHRDHRDHPHQSKTHPDKDDNTNHVTLSSEWIYDKLKEYISCIYDKQINCEDQFITELKLELLKIEQNKKLSADKKISTIVKPTTYTSYDYYIHKLGTYEALKQKPALSFKVESKLSPLIDEHEKLMKRKEDISHSKEPKASSKHKLKEKPFKIEKYHEVETSEKVFTHEIEHHHHNPDDHLLSKKDKYHDDDYDRHHDHDHDDLDHHDHHHHHRRRRRHRHRRHRHRHHPHDDRDDDDDEYYYRSDRDRYRSHSHDDDDDRWFEKLDEMIPKFKEDDDDDDDDHHRHHHDHHDHKRKDKHSHYPLHYRYYSYKY